MTIWKTVWRLDVRLKRDGIAYRWSWLFLCDSKDNDLNSDLLDRLLARARAERLAGSDFASSPLELIEAVLVGVATVGN